MEWKELSLLESVDSMDSIKLLRARGLHCGNRISDSTVVLSMQGWQWLFVCCNTNEKSHYS